MEAESPPNVTNPPKVERPKLDTPLKTDAVDALAKINPLRTQTLTTAPAIGLDFLLSTAANSAFPSFLTATEGIYATETILRGIFLGPDIRWNVKQHSFENRELHYSAERGVYKGKGITVEGFSLKSGDNFYYLNLPDFTLPGGAEPTSEQLHTMSETYSFIMDDIRTKISGKDYKAIIINVGNEEAGRTNTALSNTSTIERGRILEGKKVEVNDPKRQAVFLTREDFEGLHFDQREILHQALTSFEESVHGKHLSQDIIAGITALPKITQRDERLAAAHGLVKQLDSMFWGEAQILHNTFSDTSKDKVFRLATKSNHHPIMKIIEVDVETEKGPTKRKKLIRISFTDGKSPLGLVDLSLDEILAKPDKYRPMLLAFYLSKMLSDPNIVEEIGNSSMPDSATIMKNLSERHVSLHDTQRLVKQMGKVPVLKKFGKSLLLNLLYVGAFKAGATGLEAYNRFGPINVNIPFISHTSSDNTKGIGANSIETLPVSHPDWRIDSYGGAISRGYYMTSTYHEFKNGAWVADLSRDNATVLNNAELVTSIPETTPHLDLTKDISLDLLGKADFKLPLKERTTLGALQITDLKGNLLDPSSYTVYRLEDGTIEVAISHNPLDNIGNLIVRESLIPSFDPKISVHASQKVNKIDPAKLNSNLLSLYNPTSGSTYPRAMLLLVIRGQKYSVDLRNRDKLNKANGSPEDFANIASQLPGQSCNIANGEFTLLSTLIDGQSEDDIGFINMTTGYILEPSSPVGANGGHYLDSLYGHDFAIDSRAVVADATPHGGFTDDANTQQLKTALANEAKNEFKLDQAWTHEQLDHLKKEQEREQLLKTFEEVLGVTIVGLGGTLATNRIRAWREKAPERKKRDLENHARRMIRITLKRFKTLEELQEAAKFLGWVSWGPGSPYPKDERIDPDINREDLLTKIHWESHRTRLENYLKHDQEYEEEAGITNAENVRQLAHYILEADNPKKSRLGSLISGIRGGFK